MKNPISPILAAWRARSLRAASSRRGAIALALALQSFALAMASRAQAQDLRPAPAHQLRLDLDVPIVLIAGGVASSFFLMPEAPGVACAPSCDPSHINR